MWFINPTHRTFNKMFSLTLVSLSFRLKCNEPVHVKIIYRSHHADEVDSQENLSSRLQRSAASFLSVHLARPAGQNQEASDDGQRSGIHPYLQGDTVQGCELLLQSISLIKKHRR